MIAPELLIRSRTVPSRSGKYQAIVPPELSRARTVSTRSPVGPFKYRISKEPPAAEVHDRIGAVIERPRLRSIFVHADPVVQGVGYLSSLTAVSSPHSQFTHVSPVSSRPSISAIQGACRRCGQTGRIRAVRRLPFVADFVPVGCNTGRVKKTKTKLYTGVPLKY